MKAMAEQQFSMRTAACTVGAVKASVTPSTRSKVGHWQNRSA